MPARVIRAELLSSASMDRCSLGANLLFRNLLLAVDDYGRTRGRARAVLSVCFPGRDDVTGEQVEGWLHELETCDGDGRGPVVRYVVDGEVYLQLANWERHRSNSKRAGKSRFPERDRADAVPIAKAPEIPRGIPGASGDPRDFPGSGSGSGGVSVSGSVGVCVTAEPPAPPAAPAQEASGDLFPGSPTPKADELVGESWLEIPDAELEAECSNWLRLLSREGGDESAKLAFLRDELARIRAEAFAEVVPKNRTRSALNAKVRSKVPAWWRQRLKNPKGDQPGAPPRGRVPSDHIPSREIWNELAKIPRDRKGRPL